MAEKRSVITCDLEGRIETFGAQAPAIFGYEPDEVIGKKRVSLFSPGLIVLAHVEHWLATAREKGEYVGTTVFLKKSGEAFAADVKITPTFKRGEHIGYCGITTPRPDLDPVAAMPKIGLGTRVMRWLVVTRAPFLTATLVPVLIGAAAAAYASRSPFAWKLFAVTMLGALALHVAANTFNDYFDWTSGTDQANSDYFQPYSGGSRSIELGLIEPRQLFVVACGALLAATACGVHLASHVGLWLLGFGIAGAFSAVFYTAPPLRLAARKGLGELFVGLNFGPLLVGGTGSVLLGRFEPWLLLLGVPVGLLTTAILWVNEFPDAESDERTGKLNLVVTLGKKNSRYGYIALVVAACVSVVALVATGFAPPPALAALLAAPLALRSSHVVLNHYEDRALANACRDTILLHVAAGTMMAAGIWSARFFY